MPPVQRSKRVAAINTKHKIKQLQDLSAMRVNIPPTIRTADVDSFFRRIEKLNWLIEQILVDMDKRIDLLEAEDE